MTRLDKIRLFTCSVAPNSTDEASGGAPADEAPTAATATAGAQSAAQADAEQEGPTEPTTIEEYKELLQKTQSDLEAQKRINRNLERRSKADLKRIAQLEAAGKSTQEAEDQVDRENLEKRLEDAKAQGRNEAFQAAAKWALKAELAGKVHDVGYAIYLLGDKVSDIPVEDGEIDEEAIRDLVAELLTTHPTIKIAQGVAAAGDADLGPRKAARVSEIDTLTTQLAEAQKSGNVALSIALKQRLAELHRQAEQKGA